MIAARNTVSLMSICDDKLERLDKEMKQTEKFLSALEQSYKLNVISERIYKYHHGKYSKRKEEIENQMDECYLAMVKFKKFEYG